MSLLSVFLNPLRVSLNPFWSEDRENEGGFDIIWPLMLCTALGIWLVVERYQKTQYGAVAFTYAAPEVRPHRFPDHKLF